jgi:N-methylhydantoinase A/oxoprolinase/acetone carboxylase beta subunit
MDRMSELIIGIDRGASFTDFAVVRERILVDHLSIETRNWSDISAALEEIQGKYPSVKNCIQRCCHRYA